MVAGMQEATPRKADKQDRIDEAMVKLMSAIDRLDDFVTERITGPPDGDQNRAVGYGPGAPDSLGDFLSTLPDRIQSDADRINQCHKRLNRALFEVPGQDKVEIRHVPDIQIGGALSGRAKTVADIVAEQLKKEPLFCGPYYPNPLDPIIPVHEPTTQQEPPDTNVDLFEGIGVEEGPLNG